MAENLIERAGVWYARVQAPKELRDLRKLYGHSGRNDIWQSLGTKDRASAKRALPEVLSKIYRELDAELARLRQLQPNPLTVPNEHDIERAVWDFNQRELGWDERQRLIRPTAEQVRVMATNLQEQLKRNPPATELEMLGRPGVLEILSASDASASAAEYRVILAGELREHLRQNEFVLVDWAIFTAARDHGWLVEPGSDTYKLLGRCLIKAWLHVLDVAQRRDSGVYEGAAEVVQLAPARFSGPSSDAHRLAPKKGERLSDYLDAYLREQKGHVKVNARKDATATVRQFVEAVGEKPVRAYTRDDMAQFKRLLVQAPKNTTKLYPGVNFPEAVRRNSQDGHAVLTTSSVRNKLSMLSAFGAWLENNVQGVDAGNFSTTLPPPRNKEKARMEPFSAEDVKAVLNATAFTGCQSEKNQQLPGEVKIRDWRFWVTLIAAFTGARLNEITQLEIADVRQEAGIWVFDISDEDGRSLKTTTSRRQVPIHPMLIHLGLLEFRERMSHSGHSALFHDIPVDIDGRRSQRAGKWFRTFLTRIAVKGRGDLGGAHRWRHTITDALRRAGVEDYQSAALLGHRIDVAKMTGHYGREVTMTLQQRAELIAKVEYPSVDFDALR